MAAPRQNENTDFFKKIAPRDPRGHERQARPHRPLDLAQQFYSLALRNFFARFIKLIIFLRLPGAPPERKSVVMIDSRLSNVSPDTDRSSVLRLSLTALALIAVGLFVMAQDDSQAESAQKPVPALKN